MNRLQLIAILWILIFTSNSIAQSLVDTNNTWSYVTSSWGSALTVSYKFEGSSTINGKTYRKLVYSTDSWR